VAVAHVVGALACNTGPNGHDAGNFACNQAVDAGHVLPVAQPIGWSEELTASIDLAGTLQRGGAGGRHDGVMQPNMAVRRLTPVECERLQGFPDGYTDIKLKGKATPDGPRYKALGNSWAVPVVAWIGRCIQENIRVST
jgi:DNA (cytosine-5)-methyltransferase 1